MFHVSQPRPCIHPAALPQAWAAAATDGRGSPAHHHTNRAAGSPMGVRSTPTKHHANHHHLHHLPAHHSATSAAHALALESALQRKRASLERSVMQGSPRGGLTHDASTARGGTFAQSFAAGRAAGYPRVASVQDLGQLRQTVARDGSISSGHKQVGEGSEGGACAARHGTRYADACSGHGSG